MADQKISNMPAASTLTGAELLAGVQSAANVKVTVDQVSAATLATKACFSAYPSADQTGIATATFTKIDMNTEAFDVGGYYNTTNKRWTPPAGKVRISIKATGGATQVAFADFLVTLYKNGSRYRDGTPGYVIVANAGSSSGTWIDDANGTDYYEAYIILVTASTGSLQTGGGQLSIFQGEQI
jgi:hypothetical protein